MATGTDITCAELASRLKEGNHYKIFDSISTDELISALEKIEAITGSIIHIAKLVSLYRRSDENELRAQFDVVFAGSREPASKYEQMFAEYRRDNEKELGSMLATLLAFFEASIDSTGKFDELLAEKKWGAHAGKLITETEDFRKSDRDPVNIKDKYNQEPPPDSNFALLGDTDLIDMAKTLGIEERLEVVRLAHYSNEITTYIRKYDNKPGNENGFTLPLLINNSHHWVRAIILVSAQTDSPRLIKIRYQDSFGMSAPPDNLVRQIYAAIPNCRISARIRRNKIGRQPDSWSCGYRALKSLLCDSDFPSLPADRNNVSLRELQRLTCPSDAALCSQVLGNFFYTKLVPQHYSATALDSAKKLEREIAFLKMNHSANTHSAAFISSLEALQKAQQFNLRDANIIQAVEATVTLLEALKNANGNLLTCQESIKKFEEAVTPSFDEKLLRIIAKISFAAIGFIAGVAGSIAVVGATGPASIISAVAWGIGLSSYTYRLFTHSYCQPTQIETLTDELTRQGGLTYSAA